MCALWAARRTRSAPAPPQRAAAERGAANGSATAQAPRRGHASATCAQVRHRRCRRTSSSARRAATRRRRSAAGRTSRASRRASARARPIRSGAEARPQHAVLRRCAAGRAREAHADPRRRRGRRVVHARRHRPPRRPWRMPDLVPRRLVPVADPRELSLLQQPARRARRGLAQRRVRADHRHRRRSRRHDDPRRRTGADDQRRRGCAEDVPDAEGTYYSGEHDAHRDDRDRPAAARRLDGLGVPRRRAERHDRPREQRHQLPR